MNIASRNLIFCCCLATTVCLTWAAQPAQAIVRVGTLCTLQGEEEIHLIGRGLVIGLPGTGDGAKNATTVQSLGAVLQRLNTNVPSEMIKEADNVAYVFLSATIPASGLARGQKVDVFVSSAFGAESLRGGRLMISPMEDTNLNNLSLYGLASGAVTIEDAENPTSGRIINGLTLKKDVAPELHNRDKITLLINKPNIDYITASKISDAIFSEMFESYDETRKYQWVKFNNRSITVTITEEYKEDVSSFIAELLEVPVDNPRPQAIVSVNPRTNMISITGPVEISPTIISLGKFQVEIGQGGGQFDSVVDLDSKNPEEKLPQLSDLKMILDSLQVSSEEKVNIIRALHATGKLHAEYIEE